MTPLAKHDELERHAESVRGKATPRSTEIRPFLMRCSVCHRETGGVEADAAISPLAIPMPAHAVVPGYKCMGSGVAGVVLGRGDVIDEAVVDAERGQWGQR